MAKVRLSSIGSKISKTANYVKNLEKISESESILDTIREKIKDGWGDEYKNRIHKKNKITTWERIYLLADDLGSILPIGTMVNYGVSFGEHESKKTSPAAGVITAFTKVANRWTVVIANDNTVASGSWWPSTPEKIIRAQEIALALRLPVLYLVDCSGLFLPEQANSFPGKKGAGHIFKMNSKLSDAGVPQVAGVFGDCIAGGGYMPIISDKVYMTESAYMVIAGAALIKGAKGQKLSSLDIGGADVHVHLSNCADFRVPGDSECVYFLRKEVSKMASSAVDYYRSAAGPVDPVFDCSEIAGIVPHGPGEVYDIRQVIARLLDGSLFLEAFSNFGQEVIVGIGKVSGLYVGIASNVQDLTPHPFDLRKKRAGGILYREGVSKLSIFSRMCDDDGIPIIWLQDVSGFDVGLEAEESGLLGYGSSLIFSNSTSRNPTFTILLRKASGAGYYSMAGMPYDPIVQLSTVVSRLAVMEGKTLSIGAFKTKLDDKYNVVSENEDEIKKIKNSMREIETRIEADMDPYASASKMNSDEIVKFNEIRKYISCFAESSYQYHGFRKIKNPRIWSLHDLEVAIGALAKDENLDALVKNISDEKEIASDGLFFCSPMDGVFYLKPSLNEECFVSIGMLIEPGQTIGLIEVMKCFYAIKFNGTKSTRIKKVLIEDGSSVSAGDRLLCLE